MTLVLTCAMRDDVIQVSDRRLTKRDGTLHDDNTTKAVLYCNRSVIGYTGPAELEAVGSAQWIATQLTEFDQLEAGLNAIGERARSLLSAWSPRLKRSAVIASGWAANSGQEPPSAYIAVLSNFRDLTLRWRDTASDEFRLDVEWIQPGKPYVWNDAGQNLTVSECAVVDEGIRDAMKRNDVPGVAAVLGEQIRAISFGKDSRSTRVGAGLIVQRLSRAAVFANNGMLVSGITDSGVNGSLYIAPDGQPTQWESPWVACGGMVLVGRVGTIEPGRPSMFEP